jgi:uncharacterized protein (TIGR03435 family)
MRPTTIAVLLTASTLIAQSPWKDLYIGPPKSQMRNQSSPFDIHASNMPAVRLLSRGFGVPEHRIVGPAWLQSENYAVTAEPVDRESFRTLFQKQLTEWFHLQTHTEQRFIPVFVLKRSSAPQPVTAQVNVSAPAGNSTIGAGTFSMPRTSMQRFADTLADVVRRPVFNETNLDGLFDIKLNYEANNMASIQKAILQQLGLELADDKRRVDLFIVDYAEKPQVAK